MADELKKSKVKVSAAKSVSRASSPAKAPASAKAVKAPLGSTATAPVAVSKIEHVSAPASAPVVAVTEVASAPIAAIEPAAAPATAEIADSMPADGNEPAAAVEPKIEPETKIKPIATAQLAAAIVKKTIPAKSLNLKTKAPSGAPTSKKEFFTMTTTTAMTDTIQTAMKDAADKAKATMEKSQAAMGDMSAFAKGNVEAVVEASKILASGMQEMSKGMMTDSKSAVETMTAEIKDLAAVKSPAEFFEKQSAMMRKQFDATVAASSKNSEAMLKLVSEAFQPISNRVSLAVEKVKHAA